MYRMRFDASTESYTRKISTKFVVNSRISSNSFEFHRPPEFAAFLRRKHGLHVFRPGMNCVMYLNDLHVLHRCCREELLVLHKFCLAFGLAKFLRFFRESRHWKHVFLCFLKYPSLRCFLQLEQKRSLLMCSWTIKHAALVLFTAFEFIRKLWLRRSSSVALSTAISIFTRQSLRKICF